MNDNERAEWFKNIVRKEFKHPLGTRVWWVGMVFVNGGGFKWEMCEREVTAVRTTQQSDDDEPFKQIFLSGLTSYEGENWFDDEYQTMKESDGSEWHCSGYMCDVIFDTRDEAEKYLNWEIKQQHENE